MKDLMTQVEPKSVDTYGWDVYHWPEFKALCERLGVAWGMPTTRISIELAEDECPKIVHTYNGKDMSQPPDKPRVVDSTTIHNQALRTKSLVGSSYK